MDGLIVFGFMYLLGMFLCGWPMAKMSILLWKYPKEHRTLNFLMFPITQYCGHGDSGVVGTRFAARWLCLMNRNVHRAIHHNDTDGKERIIALYTALTMILWPIRLVWLIFAVLMITFAIFVEDSISIFVKKFDELHTKLLQRKF